jgi:hypothetical protein
MKLLLSILFVFGVTATCTFNYADAADTNTVSSTVVTNSTPPTANSPALNIVNSDICKTGVSGAVQTQVLGFSSGITIKDENCEIIKLSRQLYAMGMKVAAVSLLSSDPRVFDSMWASGTFPPSPLTSAIGLDAKTEWENNPELIPDGSMVKARLLKEEVVEIKEVKEGRHNDIKKYLLSGIALILLL